MLKSFSHFTFPACLTVGRFRFSRLPDGRQVSLFSFSLFTFSFLLFTSSLPHAPEKYLPQKYISEKKMEFKITSPSFTEGGFIPPKHTCDGKNTSPVLEWTDPPAGTVSFALIADDPDAPAGDWVHWVVFNIPAGIRSLKEESASKNLPPGLVEGINDFRKNNYGGPCPPSGTHRYFFKLYALDIMLELKSAAGKKELLAAMKGHILAGATLMGKYKRTR